jgi:osmotically-inducible protein OsmY
MNPFKVLLVVLITTILLSGCTAAVVGGATVTGVNMVHDRRTAGTYVEDESIELKAGAAIRKEKELSKQIHLNIISINGVVLLVGQAPTEAMRQQAGSITQGIEKVRLVHNEMTVAEPTSLTQRSSDSYLTTKVKASLFGVKGQEDFDPSRVKVVTENGTVYLMGILYQAEATAVAEKASQVKGVKTVVKLFEYMD